MNEEELRKHRCCFTGHRPEKLMYSENQIKPLLEKTIDNAISDGYVTFITGMARGTDIWAAEIVIERKKYNENLHLICAIPHPRFEMHRGIHEEEKYRNIIKNADYVKTISNHYFKACYQIRNEFMVDRSNRVIAVYNGGEFKYTSRKELIDFCVKHMANHASYDYCKFIKSGYDSIAP